MALVPGSRIGPYEVVAPLGEGGMGKVWRARDVALKRDAALKVLPDAFAADPDRLARFEREAQVLASLNHPNIAHVYGLEEGPGEGGRTVRALVMELVEGPTLADRLAQGAIPKDEALPIARQIAEALEAAHERGIIHRDVKPANVKLRPDGVVKVLDFGLARALSPDSVADVSNSPTLSLAATQAGMILGTAGYMSPEQARGKAVDKRTDIWAFGCVVFEMLTGRRAFQGEDVSDTLAAVLRADPPWALLPPDVPPAVRSLLRRCLERDVRRRVGDLSTARFVIEEAAGLAQGTTSPMAQAGASGRERLAWGLAAVLLLCTLALGTAWSRSGISSAGRSAPEMRVEIATSQEAPTIATFALSPDGTRLAFVSQRQVWVRQLESENAQSLAGTDGAIPSSNGGLFWSPDGESIGFAAPGQLKRIDVRSGLARSLAAAPNILGGTWAPDGTILFVPSAASPVVRISGDGGDGVAATTLAPGQAGHRFPQFLPDGRHFIFLAVGTKETRGIYVGSLDSTDTRRILESDSRAMFSPPDALLYMRQGALEARRLNLDTLVLEGDARSVASRVFVATANFNNVAMAGASGVLAYRSHGGIARLRWVDRAGRRLNDLGEPDAARPSRMDGSPTGNLVAMQRTVDGNADVWVLDTERGVQRRFTFGDERDGWPVVSRDGRQVAFSSERTGVYDLFERSADGSGGETTLLSSPEPKIVEDWSSDGRNLLFSVQNREGASDLWVLPLAGDRKPVPITQSPFAERDGRFSPDGRWIAYQSSETGRIEVYVQSFPEPTVKVQVSVRGGLLPYWRRDGRELFYEGLDGRIMAVPIDLSATAARPGAAVALFEHTGEWWPSPDGQRFLIAQETEPPAPITLILNWAGLPR